MRTTTVSVKMASITLAFITVSLYLTLPATAERLQEVLFNGNYEFIDLSHTFNNETFSWPGVEKFKFTKKTAYSPDGSDSSWYAANDFASGEHGGTHIDAPYHFYQPGKYVGDLPLDKLIIPLVVADLSSKVNGNPDFILSKTDFDFLINDNFKKPCVLLFKFGWSQYFNDTEKYLGGEGTKLRFPGLSAEVAEWITTSYKNIVGIGVDTPSVDAGVNSDFPVHKILAKAGLYNMENVNIHRPINENKCTALVLPMKIGDGTGAPLRLVAICPKDTEHTTEF